MKVNELFTALQNRFGLDELNVEFKLYKDEYCNEDEYRLFVSHDNSTGCMYKVVSTSDVCEKLQSYLDNQVV